MAYQTFEAWSGYLNYGGGVGIALQLILSSTSNGASANSSALNYWLRWTKKGTNDGGYEYNNSNLLKLQINGQTIIDTASWGRVYIGNLGAGQYVEFASGSMTIPHDPDGTKKIPVYARFYQKQRNDCDYVIHTEFTLDKINRYASVSLVNGAITKNSFRLGVNTSLSCTRIQWQRSSNGTSWTTVYNQTGSSNLSGSWYTYTGLNYFTPYKFRVIVTTKEGLSTTSAVNSITTSKPPLATLQSSVVEAGEQMVFHIHIPDSGTTYRMSVRIGDENGLGLIEDGANNQTETARVIDSSRWSHIYNAYTTSTTGTLWVRVATYSNDSNKYMDEKKYTVNFDFSSVDLSPTITDDFLNYTIILPEGLINSSFPDDFIVNDDSSYLYATWDNSKVTLKNGASMKGYYITWNHARSSLITADSYHSPSTVVGENSFKVTVIDSRNYTVDTDVIVITGLAYEAPNITLAINRNGYSKDVSVSKICKIAPLIINEINYNSPTVFISYKEHSASDWTQITPSLSTVNPDGTFSIEQIIANTFELDKAYEVKVELADTVGYKNITTYAISKAKPLFAMCDDGAVGINCYPEDEYMLSVNGRGLFIGPTTVRKNEAGLCYLDLERGLAGSNMRIINSGGDLYFRNDMFGGVRTEFVNLAWINHVNGYLYSDYGFILNKMAHMLDSENPVMEPLFQMLSELNPEQIIWILVRPDGSSDLHGNVRDSVNNKHIFKVGTSSTMEIRDNQVLAKKPVILECSANETNCTAQFRIVHSGSTPAFLIRNDGKDTFFLFTSSSAPYGTYNALRPMRINNTTGQIEILTGILGRVKYVGTSYPQIQGNNSILCLGASNDSNKNLCIQDVYVRGTGTAATNVTNMRFGTSAYRWYDLYLYTAPNVSSDRNLKHTIQDLPVELMVDFIKGLKPSSYIFNHNDSGRTHYGLISQDVEDLLAKLNIPTKEFAGFIKSPQTKPVYNEDGLQIGDEVIEGEYSYGLRYEEFIAPVIRVVQYLLDEVDKLKMQNKEYYMENKIEKPLSVRIAEMKKEMMDSINRSELIPTIIEMVLKDFYMEVKAQCSAYEQNELEQYKNALKQQEEVESDPVTEIIPPEK